MEQAEQTLAQILPHRALTPDEVREMLVPTLDALGFLHDKGLCQGGLKPSNILVVNDQLKLASDFIASDTGSGAAADIRSLGATVVEALTQRPPIWPDEGSDTVSLPASVPPQLAAILQRCLSRNSASRPTIAELAAHFNGVPQASAKKISEPAVHEAPVPVIPGSKPAAAAQKPSNTAYASSQTPAPQPRFTRMPQIRVPRTAVAAGLVVLAAAGIALPIFHRHQASQQLAASIPQPMALDAAARAETAAAIPQPSPPATSPTVLHQEIPEISHRARATIHGTIKVSVRVSVDGAGNVIGATVENRGSSKYFARLASDAARKWKFAGSDTRAQTQQLLRFEFSRGGASAHLSH
jgi:hypothetical protein